jgi:hypothetical protein
MAMEVPENVYQAMKDAHLAWDRLVALAPQNRASMSELQGKTFTLVTEILKQHHAVLNRLIEAND